MNPSFNLDFAKAKWAGFKACFDNQRLGWLTNFASFVLVLALMYRVSWYGDQFAFFTVLSALLICLICGIVTHEKGEYNFSGKFAVRKVKCILLLPLFLIYFVVGPAQEGYWVNAANSESTLTRYFLLTPPSSQPIYYVPQKFDQNVHINLKTRDGIPLQCNVDAKGIQLDERDALSLERSLIGLAATNPPEPYINSSLMDVLARNAETVLTGRTSEEIYRQGQFLIPYKIGTPVGDTLSRLMLRWSKGQVTFGCKVPFES